MSNTIQCSECFRTIRYADKLAGRTIACPGCQAKVQLTTSGESDEVIETLDDEDLADGSGGENDWEFAGQVDDAAPQRRLPARGKRKSSSGKPKKKSPARAEGRNPVVIGVIIASIGGVGLLAVVITLAVVFLGRGRGVNAPAVAQDDRTAPPDGAANPAPAGNAPSTPPVSRPATETNSTPQPPTATPLDRPVANQGAPGAGSVARVKLPGPARDMVVGGGGQYLVFQMEDGVIHIFDVARREFTGQIHPPGGRRPYLAASRRHLFMVDSGKQEVRRVDLPSGGNEQQVSYATLESIDSPACGSDSDGPLVVRVRLGGIAARGDHYEWNAIDAETLLAEPIRLENKTGTSDFVADSARPPEVCASADGRTICMWRTGVSPSGLQRFQLSEDFRTADVRYLHETVPFAQPDASGRLIFTFNAVYDGDLKRLQSAFDTVPVGVGRLFVSRVLESPGRYHWGGVYLVGVDRPLVELSGLSINSLVDSNARNQGIRDDKRATVLLSQRSLVAISSTYDEFEIHEFDLRDLLGRTETEIVVTLSAPPTEATIGEGLFYQIQAVSGHAGGLTYSLDYGPEGMAVTPEGQLTWSVPEDFPDEEVSVIVAIDTPAGTRDYHSFVLRIAART